MKTVRIALAFAFLTALAGVGLVRADDAAKPKVKPYTLDFCVVCDMKLSDMAKPYSFVYKDREIIVCDKGEAAEFKKHPAQYLKKIEEAEAKAKKQPH
jgi:hypothetical protein